MTSLPDSNCSGLQCSNRNTFRAQLPSKAQGLLRKKFQIVGSQFQKLTHTLTANQVQESVLMSAHRSTCDHLPEHTLEAYNLSIMNGVNIIESELVSTSDGYLVARHENEISSCTNVSEIKEFSDRKTTKIINGKTIIGWFTEDFTLQELKTLSCLQRIPSDHTNHNMMFKIATFEEIIKLIKRKSNQLGRKINPNPMEDDTELHLRENLAKLMVKE